MTRRIEIDEATAVALEDRAAEAGISIAQLVAQLIERWPPKIPADQIAELDRRWEALEAGDGTTSHEEAVRWLATWGKPDFRPWRG